MKHIRNEIIGVCNEAIYYSIFPVGTMPCIIRNIESIALCGDLSEDKLISIVDSLDCYVWAYYSETDTRACSIFKKLRCLFYAWLQELRRVNELLNSLDLKSEVPKKQIGIFNKLKKAGELSITVFIYIIFLPLKV